MNSFDPDHALAIILQAQFNKEAKSQKTKEKEKENRPVGVSAKSSLVDPEWEVTDPCPDIHGLFLAFNDRFFWGRLLGVEVKWSPQMTSCAGICVYEGRNGLCSVRLSAPLLKLRPRSDLVETLLHEMIHAYLFVTHNNRDRDGHGPEFHKHMNRINMEAGTNISVYHSFHAEVKLYQQHWWRCDGPCQKRPPFFGMVKRAKNRAPGPNDFWWGDHQAACGGRFVKIREPEGYGAKGKGKESKVVKPKEGKDIRNFFKKPVAVNGNNSLSSNPSNGERKKSLNPNTLLQNNVFGFEDFSSNHSSAVSVKPSNRGINQVVGFGDISASGSQSPRNPPQRTLGNGRILGGNKESNPPGKNRPSTSRPAGGMLANRGGGTLVVSGTKNQSKTDKKSQANSNLRIDDFKVFSGSGFTLGGRSSAVDRSRSRLLSLGNEPEMKKHKVDETESKKTERRHSSNLSDNDKKEDLCKCSVCNESMPREEIEIHLEHCDGLKNVFNNSTICDEVDNDEIFEINRKSKITSCPVCASNVEGDINTHLDVCLASSGILNVFDTDVMNESDSPILINDNNSPGKSPITINDTELNSPILIHDHNSSGESAITISESNSPLNFRTAKVRKPACEYDSDLEIIEPESRVACMICGMRYGESRINAHVNECLDSLSD